MTKEKHLRSALLVVLCTIFLLLDHSKTEARLSGDNNDIVRRHLSALDSYGIWAKGFCQAAGGARYPFTYLAPGSVADAEECASKCDPYADCIGFSFSPTSSDCAIHFDGYIDTSVNDGSTYPFVDPGTASFCFSTFSASGPISSTGIFAATDSVCFEKGSPNPGTLDAMSHYDKVGHGDCVDENGNSYDYVAIALGGMGGKEICAEKCDIHGNSVGFEYDSNGDRCKCLFVEGDLPDPLPLYLDPYEPTSNLEAGSGTTEVAGFKPSVSVASTCYKNSAYEGASDAAVNVDPLFIGLKGQVFKFDGRDEGWYANVASKSLQWNLRFGEYDSCPKNEDMFVTGSAMVFFRQDTYGNKQVAHSIVVKVVDEDKMLPECQSNPCLGNGRLMIIVDGIEISLPGDYPLGNVGGRIIAHNTFAACSRKWYDYETDFDLTTGALRTERKLEAHVPTDYIFQSRGEMVDSEQCDGWLKDRVENDDLFAQGGHWATVYIKTPLVSFHIEYRQASGDKEGCAFNSLDAWISDASSELEAERWKGVLGETRYPKFYSDGEQIVNDRTILLAGLNDEDYEVDEPLGTTFKALYI
eukprot:CAMPEP_0194363110 /NCGR_PEP_ID=MMETSP0174-20130528/11022_1 /TAXON_ID=216777 /ORGANISM="Proboscia alata, Strain PI-D3" /LENGTH=583 /DNA_ID=CAMNT_0039136449 /DNA_START=26 /DNA_END=1777 /DNA_ORIENTATION=+